jgi:hypothetical protein
MNSNNTYIEPEDLKTIKEAVSLAEQYINEENYRVVISNSSTRRWAMDWVDYWQSHQSSNYARPTLDDKSTRPKVRAKKNTVINVDQYEISYSDFTYLIQWMDKNEPRTEAAMRAHRAKKGFELTANDQEAPVGSEKPKAGATGNELAIQGQFDLLQGDYEELKEQHFDLQVANKAKFEILQTMEREKQQERASNDELNKKLGSLEQQIKNLEAQLAVKSDLTPEPSKDEGVPDDTPDYEEGEVVTSKKSFWPSWRG